MKKIILLAFVVLNSNAFTQKFDGLALTPPMGWNSWNTFQVNISEDLVKGIADNMVASGMKDAGYTYIVLDDGWMTMQRDSVTGNLIPDPKKFPHGMKALVDYVHSKGLKFGLYNCAGTKTCAGYPGTRGYEYQDARFYASLNIDYLKFDWCYTDGQNAKESYTTMSKALKAAGKPIVFSLCEWGSNKAWEWAANVGELWRTTGDIYNCFEGQKDMGNWKANCVLHIIDLNEPLRGYAGPGHWNDPDMLEVGNGMNVNEDRVHFSMWCMMAAPLIAGNDIRKMTADTKAILTNKDAIAVDQDALGVQGWRYASKDSVETWFKPLSNGDWALCFLNRSAQPQKINFDWKNENVSDTLSNRQLNAAATTYKIMNVWTKENSSTTAKPFTTTVPSHDVVMLRLTKQ
jgi:alpha-galactosidase